MRKMLTLDTNEILLSQIEFLRREAFLQFRNNILLCLVSQVTHIILESTCVISKGDKIMRDSVFYIFSLSFLLPFNVINKFCINVWNNGNYFSIWRAVENQSEYYMVNQMVKEKLAISKNLVDKQQPREEILSLRSIETANGIKRK